MPRYQVTLDGKTYVLEGDHPPSEAEARAAVGSMAAPRFDVQAIGKAESDNPSERVQEPTTWLGGFSKSILDQMGVGNPESALTHAARPQTAGDVASLLLPNAAGAAMSAASKAIPNSQRAATKFATVMGAAKTVPVDIEAPGQVALRIQQLAERGGTMPRMVRQFASRITDPNQGPLTYGEARDFASNISRLSADEYNRLTPVIQREVGNLRASLNDAVGQAADAAGQGDTYRSAMSEYARSKSLQDTLGSIKKGATKALPWGLGIGAGGTATYAAKKLIDLLMGGGNQ
jgi:hypothetical protein